jgi:hypothetical protein
LSGFSAADRAELAKGSRPSIKSMNGGCELKAVILETCDSFEKLAPFEIDK